MLTPTTIAETGGSRVGSALAVQHHATGAVQSGSTRERRSDRVLVELAQRGDRTAFDLLVVKYQQKIYRLTRRFVQDPSDALDVTQEAFVRAYRSIRAFRGDSAFYTWMYRIAINTAKNYRAASGRRPLRFYADLQDAEHLELMDRLKDTATPEHLALAEEIGETVEQAIRDLPDDLRTAILLREIDGMSYQEIAHVMRCPVGTVRSRIFRARQLIDKHLDPLLR